MDSSLFSKSLCTFLSAALTSNPFISCKQKPIKYLIEQSMETVYESIGKIKMYKGDEDSQMAGTFAYALQEFAKRYDYVGIVDPEDIIIPDNAPEGTKGRRLPTVKVNGVNTCWGEGHVIDYGSLMPGKAPLYHDRNICDHTPGFFKLALFKGYKNSSKENKSTLDDLEKMSDLRRLEVYLNCALKEKTPRLNSLVLGACLYCAAKKFNVDAFIVHTNLSNDGLVFEPKNSYTSVIIRTNKETFMVKFTSDKQVRFYFGDDLKYVRFKKGSYLYFRGNVSIYGLERDWNLRDDLSFDSLQKLIDLYNKKVKKENLGSGFDMADFMGSYFYKISKGEDPEDSSD